MKRNIINTVFCIMIISGCTAKQKETPVNTQAPKPYLTPEKRAIIKRYTDSLSRILMHGNSSRTGANAFLQEKAIMHNILELDSIDYTANFLMAQVHAKGKNYDSSIYYLTRVINFNPNLTRYYDFRGALWLIKSDKAKADADFKKIIAILETKMRSTTLRDEVRLADIGLIAIANVMLGKFTTQNSLDYYNDEVKKLHLSPNLEKTVRANRAGLASFNKKAYIETNARGFL
ncbi:MAG: hypothetical protein V4557_04955 [Bacteroidota bacterium]